MSSKWISLKRKRKPPSKLHSVAFLRNKIEMDLALGAGTTKIKSVDPIYYITESFRSTFDRSGQFEAAQLAEKNVQSGVERDRPQRELNQTTFEGKLSNNVSPKGKNSGSNFYVRFSEIAFKNGRLASAVLQNDGKTMFIQCMKRALGQSELNFSMRSKLFSKSSKINPLKDSFLNIDLNQYTNNAIGLVVGSILSARQTLELFKRLASDDSAKEDSGMTDKFIRSAYPFLTISEDAEMKAKYEEKLKELALLEENTLDRKEQNVIAAQKAVLAAGITKIQGLITRKRQLQDQFFYRLERLLENSRKAETDFTAPGFADNVVEEIMNSPDLPEDDDPNKVKPEELQEDLEKI